jgi:hypothetical protein
MSDVDTLAETLDRWSGSSSFSVTETNARLIVNQLDGGQARELADLIDRTGWAGLEVSDRGGEIARDLLTVAATGVSVAVNKPVSPDGVEFVLTNAAFAAALTRESIPSRFWVRRMSQAFSTIGVRFSPWGDETIDPITDRLPDPQKVVRFLTPITPASRDLNRWILRDPDAALPAEDSAFALWRTQAVHAVATAAANEVGPDGILAFRGPPISRFRPLAAESVEMAALRDLQRAATWVYDNPRELENRHGLLAAEVARNALREGSLQDLCDVAGPALEGARIAYGFGVTQQSKDTLKALSDLRKAVMDETSKLSESTRTLATAVSGAVFGAIGLVVARLTLPPNNKFVPMAAMAIALVLAGYVGAVIASGVHYLDLQRRLRTEWRPRLFSFLTPADYDKLVTDPVARAESGYVCAAWIGGILSGILILAAVSIVLTPLPPAPPAPPAPSPAAALMQTEAAPPVPLPQAKSQVHAAAKQVSQETIGAVDATSKNSRPSAPGPSGKTTTAQSLNESNSKAKDD